MEKVTVAVDPYDVEDKASIFSVNYRNYGFLPVFFVITNDSDQPVALAGMKAELEHRKPQQTVSASTDGRSRATAVASIAQRTSAKPLPIPLPGRRK